ncbi:MAG: isoleucine--tRNA ligase [Clostridia bacterium]|nr:MAG: isoleucine--tRNA ligase [Clostridia bacterium]
MDYSQTVNLPRTDFPMRARLPQREPEIMRFWDETDIYQKAQQQNRGRPRFILHDGPPYANGDIHLGTALNKILKDMVVKFHSMRGEEAPYVPGWDTHGLPIEQQAIKDLGLDRSRISAVEFRRRCRDYARKYVDVQRRQFRRLGVRGDWERPYLTLEPEFEAAQIGVFGQMAARGFIYRGHKPVYWCPGCETALAEAEVEYELDRSPSIYVKFQVQEGRGRLPAGENYVLIWTTTPWTLPANRAVAVNPRFTYDLVRTSAGRLLVARELVPPVMEHLGLADWQVEGEFSGQALEGIICRHPLHPELESPVILGDHVTLEQGTGCVHTAPGHGLEDYEVGQRYQLEVYSPLDDQGRFTGAEPDWQGLLYAEANRPIMERLEQAGLLLGRGWLEHQYPHCWRCKEPVIFRATRQWFASIDGFRQRALEEIERVRWIPAWGQERIYNMIANRSDWCISRQRTWGVPIPVFYCLACEQPVMGEDVIRRVQEIFREHGSDAWFEREARDLLPPGFTCPACGGREFRKETDTMDVWFDSGSSHAGVLETRPELGWPADLYLEGSDQHRGWFNSSLSTAVATRGRAPYRIVLTHGYVVDEQGRKMSKSLGNGIDPAEVVQELGADILRLWVASADYRRDVSASRNIFQQVADSYRKIRNTVRFLLANLYDFTPGQDDLPAEQWLEIDRWAMLRLQQVIAQVTQHFVEYEFHHAFFALHRFCVTDLSGFYLDVIKDRLYTSLATSRERRSAQTVLWRLAYDLVRMLAPILAFTTEEIWRYLPKTPGAPLSVQLAGWPEVNSELLDPDLETRWERLLDLREKVNQEVEVAVREKTIGQRLEGKVVVTCGSEDYAFYRSLAADLPAILIVSQIELQEAPTGEKGVRVAVEPAGGLRCGRCWIYHPTVGEDPQHQDLCRRCLEVLRQQGHIPA